MRGGGEMGLVDEQAIDLALLVERACAFEQVGILPERDRLGLEPDPRGNHALAAAIIEFCQQDDGMHAALAVIIGGLKQQGRFASVHRGIVEVKFRHFAVLFVLSCRERQPARSLNRR